ncbi:MAG: START domain-containing protein [Cyclobacteriaceae bacterium]
MQFQLRSVLFVTGTFITQALFSQSADLQNAEGWELKKEKYEVRVFSKEVEGYKIKAFKAIGKVEADIETVYNVIMDIENYPGWYPDCQEGELIEKTSNQEHLRRTIFDLPWPFDPRDAISRAIGSQVGDKMQIELKNEADKYPVSKKVVRISRTEGYWLLTEVDGGTEVIYSAVGEAPGVPAWIVNLFVFDGPLNAINNLREVVKEKKYQVKSDG